MGRQTNAPICNVHPQLVGLLVPLDTLQYDPKNRRLHDERNLQAIVDSYTEHGQRKPIVVKLPERYVEAGNGQLEAAKRLGWTHIAAVLVDEEERDAMKYAHRDNRTAELATWDARGLADDLEEMQAWGEELTSLGWTEKEFKALRDFDHTPTRDPDTPPLPEVAVTKPGQVIELGKHRLICGDATTPVLAGVCQSAHLLLTDPPYNVAYVGKTKRALKIANDEMDEVSFIEFLVKSIGQALELLKVGRSFYVWHADMRRFSVESALRQLGMEVRQMLVWQKNAIVVGRQDYQGRHEPCLYGWKAGAAHFWNGDRKQGTLLVYDRPTKSEDHPTQKPIAMMGALIENSTRPGESVIDPFLGSGSTLLACEQLDRVCYGSELDPRYCDVIVARWEELTGRKAKRLSA